MATIDWRRELEYRGDLVCWLHDAKNGAVIPTFDRIAAVNLGGDIVFSEPINPEGLVGQVFLVVDRSGTITNNNIYMLASVQPSGFTTGSDVMFVRSTDGGSTFSAPRRIMTIQSTMLNGIGSGRSQSRRTDESTLSGWTHATPRITRTHSFFIPIASMVELTGRRIRHE